MRVRGLNLIFETISLWGQAPKLTMFDEDDEL